MNVYSQQIPIEGMRKEEPIAIVVKEAVKTEKVEVVVVKTEEKKSDWAEDAMKKEEITHMSPF